MLIWWTGTQQIYLEIDTVGLFPTPSAINELDLNQNLMKNGKI